MMSEFFYMLQCHGPVNVLSHCHGLLGHLNATKHSLLVTPMASPLQQIECLQWKRLVYDCILQVIILFSPTA